MFTLEKIQRELDAWNIVSQRHPSKDITLYNYTRQCQYEGNWNEVTLMCRGLVLDDEQNVVCRCMGKFFNWDEQQVEYQEPFKLREKMDGSCVMLFYYDGWMTCTRGSFNSDQAIDGFKILLTTPYVDIESLPKNHTYVFEYIHPDNQIVVDYKGEIAMYYLTSYNNDSFKEVDSCSFFPKSVSFIWEFDKEGMIELRDKDEKNKEWYVWVDANWNKFKIKFDNYVQLHRFVSNLTDYSIRQMMYQWMSKKEIVQQCPDELYEWAEEVIDWLTKKASEIFDEVYEVKEEWKDKTRKEIALWLRNYRWRWLVFAMIDKKNVNQMIMKAIVPMKKKSLYYS